MNFAINYYCIEYILCLCKWFQIYLTAGRVTHLEDRINQLESNVQAVSGDTEPELLDKLENEVARVAAQVQQADRQVGITSAWSRTSFVLIPAMICVCKVLMFLALNVHPVGCVPFVAKCVIVLTFISMAFINIFHFSHYIYIYRSFCTILELSPCITTSWKTSNWLVVCFIYLFQYSR